jgi:site-specific DNA recombinase
MTTFFYGRNSDLESYEKGSSIETQLDKCKSYAVLKDLSIDKEITEQVSGAVSFNSRNKGFELMQKLKKGDSIICLEISRFSRNTLDLLQLVKKFKRMGVKLHFTDIGEVTGTDAVGSVVLTLLSSFSQFYRDQISEKSKNTKTRMRKENRYCGGKKTFGYDVDENGYLVPLEKEQEVIRKMQLMRSEGKTFQFISDELTKSTRKKFPISWIHKILNREVQTTEVAINKMVELEVA